MAHQFQFDAANGLTHVPVNLVREILRMCQAEGLQPLTLASLESFGQWLSVDKDRLNDGEMALATGSTSDKVITFVGKVLMGTWDEGLISHMRKNIHLIGSFLFVAGCNTIGGEVTTDLLHELLRLTGAVERNGTTRYEISRFVERIRGYKDYLPGETPGSVFTDISQAVVNAYAGEHKSGLIFDKLEASSTAALLQEVVEALRDSNIHHTAIKGSKGAIWLSSLLCWLRPNEVVILGPEERQIFPALSQEKGQHSPRLVIILQKSIEESEQSWKVERWGKLPNNLQASLLDLSPKGSWDDAVHVDCPSRGARSYLMWYFSDSQTVDFVGRLASVMVAVCTEKSSKTGRKKNGRDISLSDICSNQYLLSYRQSMTWFGWDIEETKDDDLQKVVERVVLDYSSYKHTFGAPSTNFIAFLQLHLSQQYSQSCRLNKDAQFGEESIKAAMELAAQTLARALCAEHPRTPIYSPYANVHDRILPYSFLKGHSFISAYRHLRRYTVSWLLRIPFGDEEELAQAYQGYVAYSVPLEHETTKLRMVGLLKVSPGGLRLPDTSENFHRLKETRQDFLQLPENNGQGHTPMFDLEWNVLPFEQDQCFMDRWSGVEHLVRATGGTLYLTSCIVGTDPASDASSTATNSLKRQSRVFVSWYHCINQILGGLHLSMDTFAERRGYVPARSCQEALQNAGICILRATNAVNDDTQRFIVARTAGNEALRFFAAGASFLRTPDDYVNRIVAIRHGPVPLHLCLNIVLEELENSDSEHNFYIIA